MTIFPSDFDRVKLYSGVGIFFSTLIFYMATSYPTVAYIDSGELAVVNWTLGIAHPSGYPLYTLIGHLFSLLPMELMKTQILLSALLTSSAVSILFLGLHGLLDPKTHAGKLSLVLCMLIFAVSPLVWSQGNTNEVYSLHLLFLTLILYIILRPFSKRQLIMGGFLLGLSFSNHLTTIMILPTVAIYLYSNRGEISNAKRSLLWSVVTGFFAVTIYLYLPVRAFQDPIFNWGNPINWENFVRHVSAWQYQVWMFKRSPAELLDQLWKFAQILFQQFPLPFWILIAIGLFICFKRYSKIALYIGVLFIVNLFYSLSYAIPDIDNYLLPSVISLFFFAVIGVIELCKQRDWVPRAIPIYLSLSLAVGLMLNWDENNESDNWAALDGVHNFGASAEMDALIFCQDWDYISPWFYSHFYLHERPDMLIIDPELVRRSWFPNWLRHADSTLYRYTEPEFDAFSPHVKLFEEVKKFDARQLDNAYHAILQKMISYRERPIYFDPNVKWEFVPGETVVGSGQLLRIIREGEDTLQAPADLLAPRYGKAYDNLNWREKWHLDDFRRKRL